MIAVPSVVCAVMVGALIAGERRADDRLRAICKPVASLAFVAQAWVSGAHDAGYAGDAVIVALLLSTVGDVALLWRSKAPFLFGLVAFLLGHLAYAAAFLMLGVDPLGALVGFLVLGAGTGLLARRFVPKAGSLAPAVIAYVIVITAMGALSVGCAVHDPTPVRLALAGAAIAFMASDICVARDRFEDAGFENRAFGLALYYAAQLVFAAAIGQT